jgi:hypothetical protein
MRRARSTYVCFLLTALAVAATVTTQAADALQEPARDKPTKNVGTSLSTGVIAGRVLTTDSGRPMRRATVFASAPELPGGRGVLTDEDGSFELTALPAGRYTVTVAMPGFVSLFYGQRRPLQPGTPIQLVNGQQVRGIQFRLPRGSVIGGHVFDSSGDPMAGVVVRLQRYLYREGERHLNPAGTATTDDQGAFRVWGLNPGNYYVDAQARITVGIPGEPLNGGLVGASTNAAAGVPQSQDARAYVPTYYPGVTSIAEARPITLGISQETLGIDFNLQFVRAARISGRVTNPDGGATESGDVSLVAGGRNGGFAVSFAGHIRGAGTFEILNVPPGQYTLQARGTDDDPPDFASQPFQVAGADITDVSIQLGKAVRARGAVTFSGSRSQPPDLGWAQLQVAAVSVEPSIVPMMRALVDAEGHFIVEGVPPGPSLIRPVLDIPGWVLQSVTVNGRDVSDKPIDLRPGQELSNVLMTFTDNATEVSGTIATDQGVPVTDYTVLAFSTDPAVWHAYSRRIVTARPDQNGKFTIRGLPAGSYYLVPIDPAEPGEWLDAAYLEAHRLQAVRLTLAAGEVKTQDFRVIPQ